MNKQDLITILKMSKHREGGYFSETYKSPLSINISQELGNRAIASSMYYMLTNDSPIGYLHINKSDILHFYQFGSPMIYYTIDPDGKFDTFILGPDIKQGQVLQKIVKGGVWKASILKEGEFGLLGEAVTPGFEYGDSEMATLLKIKTLFPNLLNKISHLIQPEHIFNEQ